MSNTERRNYGIDMLRCISMFFVIIQHLLGQGGIMENTDPASLKHWLLSFLQFLSYCAVDVYGITTGYLLCRKSFRLSRIVNLWLTTVFWSVAVSCGFFLLVPGKFSVKECVSMFLPILRGRYWFFTAYFVVMLLSPVLNHLICTLSRRQFHLLFVAVFLIFGVVPIGSLGYDVMRISGGNHFSWMIVLYLIGGYLSVHYPARITVANPSPTRWITLYLATTLIHLLYKLLVSLVGLPQLSNLMLTNVSPLVVAGAVCLFLHFRDVGFRIPARHPAARILSFAAPGVYSVYVIHVHPLIFWNQNLISLLRPWDSWNALTVLGAVLAASAGVFWCCILLDVFRQKIFALLHTEALVQKLSQNVTKLVTVTLNGK